MQSVILQIAPRGAIVQKLHRRIAAPRLTDEILALPGRVWNL